MRYKFSILRIATRVIIFGLFALSASGVFGGVLMGDLSSSLLFSTIPLSDPLAVLQICLAFGGIGISALIGGIIIACFYAIIAPRAFCGWVCPVGLISDMVARFKRKFGMRAKILSIKNTSRYYILAAVLLLSLIFQAPIFESVSFIGVIQRGLIFGGISWIFIAILIAIFDLFVLDNATCGYICPLGAFYSLLGRFSLLKIHYNETLCTKCGECEKVCPEKQVLDIIGAKSGIIKSGECMSCAKCIEVCEDSALEFNIKNLRRKNEN